MKLQDLLQARYGDRGYWEDWGDLSAYGRVFYDPPLPYFVKWVEDVLQMLLTNSTSERPEEVFSVMYSSLPQDWWFANVVSVAKELESDSVLEKVEEFRGRLKFINDLRSYFQEERAYISGALGWIVIPSVEIHRLSVEGIDNLLFEIRSRTGSKSGRQLVEWVQQVDRVTIKELHTSKRRYNVFISHSSRDYSLAKAIYDYLTESGLAVFLSEECLQKEGISNFVKGIEEALEGSTHMLVVTSTPENVLSSWVEAEWRMFFNEMASGRKTGNLVTVTVEVSPDQLPLMLRSYEVIPFGESGLKRLPTYFN